MAGIGQLSLSDRGQEMCLGTDRLALESSWRAGCCEPLVSGSLAFRLGFTSCILYRAFIIMGGRFQLLLLWQVHQVSYRHFKYGTCRYFHLLQRHQGPEQLTTATRRRNFSAEHQSPKTDILIAHKSDLMDPPDQDQTRTRPRPLIIPPPAKSPIDPDYSIDSEC